MELKRSGLTENAKKQARFSENQHAMGRKARKIWATDEEIQALRLYLKELRTNDGARRI